MAFATSEYEPSSVLMAATMTAGVAGGITLYAWNTDSDVTVGGGAASVILSTFSLAGLFFMFSTGKAALIFYSSFGVIIFGFYVLHDTQLIMGGRSHELDSEDYIIAVMILYLDIINLFMHLLRLIGERRN